jgi:hypothetical protein
MSLFVRRGEIKKQWFVIVVDRSAHGRRSIAEESVILEVCGHPLTVVTDKKK